MYMRAYVCMCVFLCILVYQKICIYALILPLSRSLTLPLSHSPTLALSFVRVFYVTILTYIKYTQIIVCR